MYLRCFVLLEEYKFVLFSELFNNAKMYPAEYILD